MQQVLTVKSGVSFSKKIYKNTLYTPNEHGQSSADKLLKFQASQDDIKYVALFYNLDRRNLRSVRKSRSSNSREPIIEGSVRDYDGTISTFLFSEEDINELQTQIDMRTEV